MQFRRKFVLIFCLALFSVRAFSQANENIDMLVQDTKSDLMIVVGGGLAGAVLGLSTLSFVEEPKDHTRNIIVGASLGIIAGVGYVAFSQATKTQDMLYGEEGEEYGRYDFRDFNSRGRIAWHRAEVAKLTQLNSTPYQFNYQFSF